MKKQILLGMVIAATLLGLVAAAAIGHRGGGTAVTRHVAERMDCTHECG